MEKFAVIFDMDGVLVESGNHITKSFDEVLREEYGVKKSTENRPHGLSLNDHVKLWKKKYGIDINPTEFSERSFRIEQQLMNGQKPNKYLILFLEDLKNHMVSLGVGTASFGYRAEKILKMLRLRKYFSAIVSAEDVKRHKPYPDTFLEVAKKLGVRPEMCVVVEDAESGIEAAKKGNMKTIGYLTSNNTRQQLKGADLTIDNFSQICYRTIKELFE